MAKKHMICMHCFEELDSNHINEGNLRFCGSDCHNEYLEDLPPNADKTFIKEILEH